MVLVGCAGLPQPTGFPLSKSADAFSFSGRIAVRERERNLSGGILWRHDASRDEILLTSPLGQGVAQLTRDADGAVLRTADGEEYRAGDAEDLAWRVTGWRIPVDGLAFWLRGSARSGSVAGEERDPQGRLLRLAQDDWMIEFTAYFAPPEDRLPRRMVLTRPEFEMKLIIDQWDHAQ